MRTLRSFAARAALVAVLALCACGGAGKLTCSDDAACGAGRRCARTVSGESNGACVADDHLAFLSPADQALLTAGSVPVTVQLTLGSPDQTAPSTVDLFVDGTFARTLSLASKSGTVASYSGSVTLASGQTVTLEAFAARGTLDEVSARPVQVTGRPTPPPPAVPTVTSVALVCQAESCVRDEVISVSATVENGPASVRVWTDLASGTTYPLANVGGGTSYSGTIPLAALPFPAFAEGMSATVEALDASNTVVSSSKAGVNVTRLRWAYDAGAAVTSPAVMDNGTLVVGLSKTSGQVVAVKPIGTQSWVTTLEAQAGAGGGLVTSAPAIGKKAVWVGSDDGRLYAVGLDGSGLVNNGLCPSLNATPPATAGHIFTPLVYQPASGPDEAAYTGGAIAVQLGLAPSASSPCSAKPLPDSSKSMRGAPVMNASGAVFVGLGASDYDEIMALFAANAGAAGQFDYHDYYGLSGPALAIGLNGNGAVLVADGANEFNEMVVGHSGSTLNAGWFEPAGTVKYGQEAMVVSSAGEPITGGQIAGVGWVDRLTSDGKLVQDWPVSLGTGSAGVTGLALAAVDGSGVALYATTSSGDLFALDQNGAVVWSTQSGSTQLLGTDRLDFPTIAPPVSGQALPTLYAGSTDGHLYAVVVDSGLDPAAPWPKAHHDLRNTGNAMAVRP